MGNDRDQQFHYTPSSVGALMDPGFLRQAVHDADSSRCFSSELLPSEPLPRWRVALGSVIGACLHAFIFEGMRGAAMKSKATRHQHESEMPETFRLQPGDDGSQSLH